MPTAMAYRNKEDIIQTIADSLEMTYFLAEIHTNHLIDLGVAQWVSNGFGDALLVKKSIDGEILWKLVQ